MKTIKQHIPHTNQYLKRLHPLLAAGLLLGATGERARALVLPVLEDTATGITAANTAGKATSLKASTASTAFIRFGVGNLTNIAPKDVKQARLTVYVSSVLK